MIRMSRFPEQCDWKHGQKETTVAIEKKNKRCSNPSLVDCKQRCGSALMLSQRGLQLFACCCERVLPLPKAEYSWSEQNWCAEVSLKTRQQNNGWEVWDKKVIRTLTSWLCLRIQLIREIVKPDSPANYTVRVAVVSQRWKTIIATLM